MNNNYVTYHLHSDDSLLDSCTNYKEYVDYAVSLGQKAIAFTEHGKPMCWANKKMYCDSVGIKYIHGVECYLTRTHDEKVRDNFHTILLAKNQRGFQEINQLISMSTDEKHTYYVNRLSFDEFLSISDNVIKISACLASPLNKLSVTDEIYSRLAQHYDYYEIQPHNCEEQKNYNIHLAVLAERYGKPLIAGTDTHSLNNYKAECRKILLKYKDRAYGDEDTFDLTYKTHDELVKAFEENGALPANIYLQAIENTNIMADSVEELTLDKSLKYPILYGSREKDKEVFHQTIERKFKEKIENNVIPEEQIPAFKEAIEEEKRVFSKIQMDGFMLSMSELISWCKDNNIPTGFARGSVGGSRVAYITDVIDLNPETWHTVFSRFCNEDREEVGDIDIDVTAEDQQKIFKYIIERFGSDKTARVPTFGTMVDKATIDGICNALDKYWKEENPNANPEDSPYSLKMAKKIKDDYNSNPDRAKSKYSKVFYYFDGLLNTKVSQSIHPAGIVISPITLYDNYGVFNKGEDGLCLMIDMEEIHDIGLVKYDFLVLKTLPVIQNTYKFVGLPYPRSHEIDWNDIDVWNSMIKNPTGIFQMEGEYAHSLLRQFRPKSIFDMSLVTAAIRPSGSSYRNDLMEHKINKNPSEIIDKLLENNLGYLVYQEDVIAFLQQICGLSGSEADNVRRAIGRKDKERLDKALPQIFEGYCQKSPKPRAEAEAEAQTFLKIIEDASSYMFGYNHSIAYCLVGYLCAYLRHYYPIEFITSYLNNAANEADITNGTELAKEYGIVITPPRFGLSRANYYYDKTNKTITKGIGSVKYLNDSIANELYELGQRNFNTFTDLLLALQDTSINSRQLTILIKINYFANFGNINELLRIYDFFTSDMKDGLAKTIATDKLQNRWYEDIVKKYATNVNAKGQELKKYTITDIHAILTDGEAYIKSLNLPELNTKLIMEAHKEYLGYIDLTTNKEEDRRKLLIESVIPLRNKDTDNIWAYALSARSIGSGKTSRLTVYSKLYNTKPIHNMGIIYATDLYKNNKGYWYLQDYTVLE